MAERAMLLERNEPRVSGQRGRQTRLLRRIWDFVGPEALLGKSEEAAGKLRAEE